MHWKTVLKQHPNGPFYYERKFIVVSTGLGEVPFYLSSGSNSGMAFEWFPFGGFVGPSNKLIKTLQMEIFQNDPAVKAFWDAYDAGNTPPLKGELEKAARKTSNGEINTIAARLKMTEDAGEFPEAIKLNSAEEANSKLRELGYDDAGYTARRT